MCVYLCIDPSFRSSLHLVRPCLRTRTSIFFLFFCIRVTPFFTFRSLAPSLPHSLTLSHSHTLTLFSSLLPFFTLLAFFFFSSFFALSIAHPSIIPSFSYLPFFHVLSLSYFFSPLASRASLFSFFYCSLTRPYSISHPTQAYYPRKQGTQRTTRRKEANKEQYRVGKIFISLRLSFSLSLAPTLPPIPFKSSTSAYLIYVCTWHVSVPLIILHPTLNRHFFVTPVLYPTLYLIPCSTYFKHTALFLHPPSIYIQYTTIIHQFFVCMPIPSKVKSERYNISVYSALDECFIPFCRWLYYLSSDIYA